MLTTPRRWASQGQAPLSTGTPTSPGADYYLPDTSYKEYARRLVGTYPAGVGLHECMHWCLELYHSWGCRFISVTSQNNYQYVP